MKTKISILAAVLVALVVPAQASAATVVYMAGDIAGPSANNVAAQTAAIISGDSNTDYVVAAGDNEYDSGTLAEYKAYYGPTWGVFNSKINPVPGNHEYLDTVDTPGPAQGYRDYFGLAVGAPTYYTWTKSNVRFVMVDSEIQTGTSSTQYAWLSGVLSTNTSPCLVAVWHRPRFSSGIVGDRAGMKPMYTLLNSAGADLIVNGHSHNYERFLPQDVNGVATAGAPVEIVAGTGGEGLQAWANPGPPPVFEANSAYEDNVHHGVLKLTVTTSNTWTTVFRPVGGANEDSYGPNACHAVVH